MAHCRAERPVIITFEGTTIAGEVIDWKTTRDFESRDLFGMRHYWPADELTFEITLRPCEARESEAARLRRLAADAKRAARNLAANLDASGLGGIAEKIRRCVYLLPELENENE